VRELKEAVIVTSPKKIKYRDIAMIKKTIGVKTYLQYRTLLNRFVTGLAILSTHSVEMRKTRRFSPKAKNAFTRSSQKVKATRRTPKEKQKEFPTPGPSQCHPRVGDKRPPHGCLPPEVLTKAAKQIGILSQTNVSSLRKALEQRLNVKPDNEMSFLYALPFSEQEKQELAKLYLRPQQPPKWKEDPDMWLDSTNIDSVMKQYEEAFPSFEFMGPFPIDFAAPDPYIRTGEKKCLIREICGLRMEEALKQGTNSVGIIYNLDPHFKDGSHWVANYIDIPNHCCYYFDSYGYEPPKQIATFMKWLTTQDPKMKLMYNARRFQHLGSECGMYSMYFIIRMLTGDSFRPFCKRQPRDSVMLDLRDWMFST
jgi:hypothetical protein